MLLRRLRNPVEQLQPVDRGSILCLRKAGWTYRRTAAHVGHNVSVVCRCFQKYSEEHSHTRRPGSGQPRSTDVRQDRRIVRPVMAARTASGRNPGTCCICCFTNDHWEPTARSMTKLKYKGIIILHPQSVSRV